jgi:SprT protein
LFQKRWKLNDKKVVFFLNFVLIVEKLTAKDKIQQQLKQFLPEGFEEMIADLLFSAHIQFKIVKPRNTKLGDYRPAHAGKPHRITVNGNLNKFSFLITTVHEFAHLTTYLEFGRSVSPHGNEWKNHYRKLLIPVLDKKILPKDIENALINSLVNTKASSCADIPLMRVLKNYDKQNESFVFIEDIEKNAHFMLQGKEFIKGELRRKRFLCEDVSTKKKYLIHTLAEVIPIFE